MGTFHDNKGALHGITVAVEVIDGTLYVGRCDESNDDFTLLLKYDTHSEEDTIPREEWLEKAKKWGVHPKHKFIRLPASEVKWIKPLGQL